MATAARLPRRSKLSPPPPILASLASAIGGDKIEVQSLVPDGFNADLYSPRPSDSFKIHQAKLFIQIGLGLEDSGA